jgi:hypothetical protein
MRGEALGPTANGKRRYFDITNTRLVPDQLAGLVA